MKYSIVIPTYNHCDDLLKPCIDSIIKNTDLSNVEVIIVANGCTDHTKLYVESLSSNFKLIWSAEPLGYTKATNLGIKKATGEYVILMNNDIVLHNQPKNYWLELLENPFIHDELTGITGPVKFTWDCGGITRAAMAFWLIMMRRDLFAKIGMLDEIFSPGMGEDGDFSIKTELAGYKLTSVPADLVGEFEVGIKNIWFPIWHKGNGTFADDDTIKNSVIQRNIKILENRYGKAASEKEISIVIPTYNHFHDAFKPCIDNLLQYTDLTNKEVIVVANGCTDETKSYLDQLGDRIKYIWFDEPMGYIKSVNAGIRLSVGKYVVLLDNDSILMSQPVDQWINVLKKPFDEDKLVGASSPFAHDYEGLGLILHSGCTMYDSALLKKVGMFDEIYHPGYLSDSDVSMKIWQAGYKCVEVPEYNSDKKYKDNMFAINFPVIHTGQVATMDKIADVEIIKKNRALLYSRYNKPRNKMKYSVVIPTYNHCDDLLKPCIDSIKRYSDTANIEIIVVANGCTDNTKEYAQSLGDQIKLIWVDEAIGYTKATNMGIKQATGEYVILLNNDTELLQQPTNTWLNMLEAPFIADPQVGLTGPLELYDNYSNAPVLIFFCVMIKRDLFDKIGLLDEIFTPGGGEDIDFTIRANKAGYKSAVLEKTVFSTQANTNVASFPIWHKDNRTFREIPEYTKHIVKRNGLINCKRYNKDIKLNLGAGGIEYPGYLSVDMHDSRANVHMDITKLDFETDSVSEILASHVFEHLNPYKVMDILQDWLRVLKPGGRLIMEMPNIEELCRRFVTANKAQRYGILNAVYGSVNTTDVGQPSDITSPHLFGWWPESLFDHMYGAGFREIQFMDEKIPHPESNFRVEAIKPLAVVTPPSPPVNREWLKQQEPATFLEIFEQDSYGILPEEIAGKTVIDIGANLGMFSLRCVELGAKKIIAVEAQPTIYNLGLTKNIEAYPSITAVNYAAYHEDNQIVFINNQHVGSKLSSDGDAVPTITLATLLNQHGVTDNDIALKIDCEGSEFNVLMTATPELMQRINVIYIELHGACNSNPAWHDPEIIRLRLMALGFKQKKISQQYGWEDPAYPVPMNIFVEKWAK